MGAVALKIKPSPIPERSRQIKMIGHSKRVSEYSCRIAAALGIPRQKPDHLMLGALLHDVGKIGTPEQILNKPSELTPQEFDDVQRHPLTGVKILEHMVDLGTVMDCIKHHHEHFDGSGYPDGLAGEAIPLNARIVAVADTYDAMVSGRPYRAARTPEAALAELESCAGTQLDSSVVQAFCRVIRESLATHAATRRRVA